MERNALCPAILTRLPRYLAYLQSLQGESDAMISSAALGDALNISDVVVRKDLAKVCDKGLPRSGRLRSSIIHDIEKYLLVSKPVHAVVIGSGYLSLALLECEALTNYGVSVLAGFGFGSVLNGVQCDKPVLRIEELSDYCQDNHVDIGILTCAANEAQAVCDLLIRCGIRAIWNFSPCTLVVPAHIFLKQENIPGGVLPLCLALKKDIPAKSDPV